MSAVRFERVTKTFAGGVTVLRDVDLAIEEGELCTLVGPSGCGKSTLLNLLAGFEQPTSGHVLIDGRVVDHLSPRDRGVAMVFQSYALYPHLDVRGNVAFPLSIAGIDRREIAERVQEVAARLGLTELLGRRPADLSGGQRQRVALARALVRRPKLCLLDEPLSNLDAALRGKMRAEIKRLHQELGATFVYVTHDQAEAMTLSDRLVVLEGGRIAQVGTPREVYDAPASAFVAGFIGSPPINLVAPAVLGLETALGEGVTAGLRPEALEVSEVASEGAISGAVWVVEPMGPETWVTVAIGASTVVGRAPANFAGKVGDLVWARFERVAVMVFDAASGARRDLAEASD